MRRWSVASAAVVLLAAAALTAVPGSLGLAAASPLAQLVPFRGVLALGTLLVAGLLALAARRGRRSAARAPRRPRAAAVLAAGLAVVALVHAGVLVARGVAPASPAPRQDGDLVVLSLNTEHGGATARQVAAEAERAGADVVALPETPAATAQEVADLLAAAPGGRRFTASTATTSDLPTHATSLLVADDLGRARPATAPAVGLAAVGATPAGLPGPVIAAHALAPVPWPVARPGAAMVATWAGDLPRVAAACADAPGAVVAGDLNATLDHPGLRDLGPCVDAAAAAGAGGLGTWPSVVPELLAAPIDHVLVDGRTWRVVSAAPVAVGASDHRGLLVHLARRAPAGG